MSATGQASRVSDVDISPKPHLGSSKDQVAAAHGALSKPGHQVVHPHYSAAGASMTTTVPDGRPQHSHTVSIGDTLPMQQASDTHQANTRVPQAHAPTQPPPYNSYCQHASAVEGATAMNPTAAAAAVLPVHSNGTVAQSSAQFMQSDSFSPDPQLGSPALPEAAPALKTDPVELSLLNKYLAVVRQTQGEAAAAQAMAASGLPMGINLEAEPTARPPINVTDTEPSSHITHTHVPTSAAPPMLLSAAPTFSQSKDYSGPASTASCSTTPTSTAATAAAPPTSLAAEPLAISNLLGFIKQRKLAGVARQHEPTSRRSSSGSTSSAQGGGAAAVVAAGAASTTSQGRKVWIQPSGPRRPGEGVENEEQGILSAEEMPTTGEVIMRITLLAAGFVIGPSGSSVREIVRLSGADINSWTEATGTYRGRRPARIFLIKGEPSCVTQAVYVITAAVDRYKELCEGKYTGQSVPRSQNVLGVTFSYQPPPKSIVPCAASLKELYAPPHTVANSARYAVSPAPIFGLHTTHPTASNTGIRGSPPQLSPYAHQPFLYDGWQTSAMLNAAATMGLNPLQALIAAGGHHNAAAAMAAAAGYGGLGNLGAAAPPFGAVPAGMMGLAGVDGLGAVGAGTPPPGALDPVSAAAAAAGMPGGYSPFAAAAAAMGGADTYAAPGPNMYGMFPGLAGGVDGGPGAVGPGIMDGFQGFGGPANNPWWFPGGYDPTGGMAAVMAGAGMYGALGDPSAPGPMDFAATGVRGFGGPHDAMPCRPLRELAGQGLGGAHGQLGSIGDLAAGSNTSTPTAAAATAEAVTRVQPESRHPAGGTHANAAPAATAGNVSSSADGSSRDGRQTPPPKTAYPAYNHVPGTGPLWPGGLPPPSPFYRGPGLHLPHLVIPQEPAEGPHAGSPRGAHVRPPQAPGMPFLPASPGAPLLSFGPLFHPMSPAGPHMPPMSPYMAPMPFGAMPASPVRLMRDKSGQQIPYIEVGGTVYFAPTSPMPHTASPQPSRVVPPAPPTGPYPGNTDEKQVEVAATGTGSAGKSGSLTSAEQHTEDQQHSQTARRAPQHSHGGSSSSDGGGGDVGRPRPAIRLYNDNPYLSQGAIGSGSSSHHHQLASTGGTAPQHQSKQQQGSNVPGSASVRTFRRPNTIPHTSSHNSVQQPTPSPSPPPVPAIFSASATVDTAGSNDTLVSGDRQPQQRAAANMSSLMDQSRPPRPATPASGGFASRGKSPSMHELDAAVASPEAGAAAAAGTGGSSNRPAAGRRPEAWLDAHDPIVSPGRITLASKVKAARLYNTSGTAGATHNEGRASASPRDGT